jgi:PTH1 family peptidyl-tRNA hydrolase
MFLIAGLGNPGEEYKKTRHNIGFLVLDYLSDSLRVSFSQTKWQGTAIKTRFAGSQVLLLKPQTYMNNSGQAVADVINFYKETTDKVIVIYDDTSLDIGRLRIRERGSAGGHNGIKSIISHLKTQEFDRVKVGVGEKPPGWNLADYVLSRFDASEIKTMKAAIKMSAEATVMMIDEGAQKAMNIYNSMGKPAK